MKDLKVKYLITVILLILTACFIYLYKKANKVPVFSIVDLKKIPMQVGEWRAKDIPVESNIFRILETPLVLIREYTNSRGESLFLTIVYYQNNRVELHLPERCSVGHGSYIDKTGKEIISTGTTVNTITVNKFLVKGKEGREVTLYYFESDKFITASYLSLRLRMIINKIKGKPNSGGLVKFSAVVKYSPDETIEMLKNFISQISPLLSEYLI